MMSSSVDQWTSQVADLRERNHRKPSFTKRFDRADLGYGIEGGVLIFVLAKSMLPTERSHHGSHQRQTLLTTQLFQKYQGVNLRL